MTDEIKLRMKKSTLLALQKLAMKRGHTLEETLHHAANTEVYMDTRLRDGGIILCQDIEGELWKVVFTHMKTIE